MTERRVEAAAVASAKAIENVAADHTEGMSFLSTLPQRVVRVYIPLILIVFVLLFPFYWMTMTAIKPKEHLLDLDTHNPFFTLTPTFEHILQWNTSVRSQYRDGFHRRHWEPTAIRCNCVTGPRMFFFANEQFFTCPLPLHSTDNFWCCCFFHHSISTRPT